ncbi:MAG TPA: mandelate racemase/muconate lactonizing enzyme family protein [Verrucomicrobiales bacterium]|nr:mandelate racemase/muconate lactonizing enzyme family protein [Verrucomicrobiales bacterium]
MIITSLETFILHVPVTRNHISDSTHSITHWGMPGVRIFTDEGFTGYGFTGTHAHLASDRLITDCISNSYAELLIGQEVSDITSLWDRLAYHPPLQWIGRAGITKMALAAVDIALWDIKSKASDEPLWKTLGGTEKNKVEAYNTDGGWLNLSIQMLVDDVLRLTEVDGYKSIKMKVGKPDHTEDLQRIEAVRSAVGPSIRIMTDANGRWRMPEALSKAGKLKDYDVTWIEEPLWHDDVRGHKALADSIETPVALGEMLYSVAHFEEFISSEAVHYVQPDATRLGGITEALEVSNVAYEANLPVTPHAGDMAQTQIHLSISHPGIELLEFIPWIKDCFIEPLEIRSGYFDFPQCSGAGTTLTEDAMSKYAKKVS